MRYTLQQPPEASKHGVIAEVLPARQHWSEDAFEQLIENCFNASPDVRYVAVYAGDNLLLRARDGLSGASSAESDKYEELLVNPTLIKLASQRGDIDCGGLRFLLIRYGHFFQCLYPTRTGHVSVALEPRADITSLPGLLARLIGESSSALVARTWPGT